MTEGRVLLLRGAQRAAPLLDRLTAAGHRVAARPVIDVAPPRDSEPVRAAVAALPGYDLVVFSSTNGVRAFLEIAGDARPGAVAAVGPATAAALCDAGLPPAVVAEDARGEGLAAALLEVIRPGQRVLVVRPEVARDVVGRELRGAGAVVDEVAFYRNVESADLVGTARSFAGDGWDVTVFFAPSNVERLCAALARAGIDAAAALRGARSVAIGEVTAAALRAAGAVQVVVATSPTDAALADAVAAALVLPSPAFRRPD